MSPEAHAKVLEGLALVHVTLVHCTVGNGWEVMDRHMAEQDSAPSMRFYDNVIEDRCGSVCDG
jgi:hypothetical protein